MQVIPVIDLQNGQVVRGVAGKRRQYRPVHLDSRIVSDSTPKSVARAFAARGFRRCYVADLDSIEGGPVDERSICEVAGEGLSIWLDVGLSGPDASVDDLDRRLPAAAPLEAVVVASETIPDGETLERLLQRWGAQAVVSLDLRDGKLQSPVAEWREAGPLELVARATSLGCRRFIVLDLTHVGMEQGVPTLELCREMRAEWPDVELISGGGVRTSSDLDALHAAGCTAALVATAIHAGGIGPMAQLDQ